MIELKKLRLTEMEVTIVGLTELVTHNWDAKSGEQMRAKHAGVRGRTRAIRNPEAEFEAALYKLADGTYGFPARGIKKSIAFATQKDLTGLPRTQVFQGLFIHEDCPATRLVKIIHSSPPKMREDYVKVGQTTDLRYRPSFEPGWRIMLRMQFDEDKLNAETVVNLIERAGFGIGIGEDRPEKKGGDWGRYQVLADKEEQA